MRRMHREIKHKHIPLMSELNHNWEAKLSTWYADDPDSVLTTIKVWPDDAAGTNTHKWLWQERRTWVDNGYGVSFDSRERVELGWKHKRVQLVITRIGPRSPEPDLKFDFTNYNKKR